MKKISIFKPKIPKTMQFLPFLLISIFFFILSSSQNCSIYQTCVSCAQNGCGWLQIYSSASTKSSKEIQSVSESNSPNAISKISILRFSICASGNATTFNISSIPINIQTSLNQQKSIVGTWHFGECPPCSHNSCGDCQMDPSCCWTPTAGCTNSVQNTTQFYFCNSCPRESLECDCILSFNSSQQNALHSRIKQIAVPRMKDIVIGVKMFDSFALQQLFLESILVPNQLKEKELE